MQLKYNSPLAPLRYVVLPVFIRRGWSSHTLSKMCFNNVGH